ncbi:MAG: glycosyltransferase [Bacteroidetes bacterium]|nr:MAG: glycosyltransferase [Bacteroidota bacterium]
MVKEPRPLSVVQLGTPGFPYGLAAMQRILLMCKGLVGAGARVTVLSSKGVHTRKGHPGIQKSGTYEGIAYHYTSPSQFRPDSFVSRNWEKIAGTLGEISYLFRHRRDTDAALVYITGEFWLLLYYRILSRLFGFRMLISYVEFRSGFESRDSWSTRLNDRLFDRYIGRLSDTVLPISEYLARAVQKEAPKTLQLKSPVICDFEEFAIPKEEQPYPYFLFCGSANYLEVIEFVLESFEAVANKRDFHLHLVSGGKEADLVSLRKRIAETPSKDRVHLFSNIPRAEIPVQMVNSSALLIPLRNTIQDEARFPHKIGEYTAAGAPIITTGFGEIPWYFRDEESALIAQSYEISAIAEKMQWVADHPEQARAVGLAGHEVGRACFDHLAYGQTLYKHIAQLCGKPAPAQEVPVAESVVR